MYLKKLESQPVYSSIKKLIKWNEKTKLFFILSIITEKFALQHLELQSHFK